MYAQRDFGFPPKSLFRENGKCVQFVGKVGPVGDGKKFVIEGEFECVGGTGRYEGYKGTGTFKGERVGVIKDGGDAYYDFTMNCRKP